jgi:DNA-binding HxlR family transcriptional regulator
VLKADHWLPRTSAKRGEPSQATRDDTDGYLLTDLGAALRPALGSLQDWAGRWSAALQEAGQAG